MDKRQKQIIFVILFALSLLLRFSLSIVNREAGDDHVAVANLIIKLGRLPSKADCEECFQPKLFHSVVAQIFRVMSTDDSDFRIVAAQMLNFLASVVLIWYLWRFIRSLEAASDNLKLLAFGLVAFNPALVAVNVQATNDTFVITFASMALYYAHAFIRERQTRHFTLIILCSALTIFSKTNGLIVVFAIGITFLLEAVTKRNYSLRWGMSDLLITGIYGVGVLVLGFIVPFAQYISNYQKYGSPLALNIAVPVQPFPKFFEKTDTYQPGILSIQDGFFTFKIYELIRQPQLTPKANDYPSHRTSFWTILYARASFIHYGQFPPSWRISNIPIRILGRVIYIFALFPFGIILIGFAVEVKNLFKWNTKRIDTDTNATGAALLVVAWLSILAFQIAYALLYRMYFLIKPAYIYPAVIAVVFFFIVGWNVIQRSFLAKSPRLSFLLNIAMYLLIGLYALDALALFLQLSILQ